MRSRCGQAPSGVDRTSSVLALPRPKPWVSLSCARRAAIPQAAWRQAPLRGRRGAAQTWATGRICQRRPVKDVDAGLRVAGLSAWASASVWRKPPWQAFALRRLFPWRTILRRLLFVGALAGRLPLGRRRRLDGLRRLIADAEQPLEETRLLDVAHGAAVASSAAPSSPATTASISAPAPCSASIRTGVKSAERPVPAFSISTLIRRPLAPCESASARRRRSRAAARRGP